MNNNMILELVNAGCDLRKLSPEFLEKLCGVYEGATPAAEAPTPVENKTITKADVIELLMIAKSTKEVRMKYYGPSNITLLIDDLVNGTPFDDETFIYNFKEVRRMDSIFEIREAVKALTTYIEEHTN